MTCLIAIRGEAQKVRLPRHAKIPEKKTGSEDMTTEKNTIADTVAMVNKIFAKTLLRCFLVIK
jgi:hypothetical protein